ncbi:hypothetical protein GCM10009760_21250 [Kitasatospora kazusensis]|uniref:Methyltransferase family protein n=1 Tax=Kitasatospora kazusensis TaxID=407974 RepID=A0ABN2ZAF0_9ACTN
MTRIRRRLLDASDAPDAESAMGELWRLCVSVRDSELVDALERSPGYRALRAFFSVRWAAHVRQAEFRCSLSLPVSEPAADAPRRLPRSVLAEEGYRGVADELSLLGPHRVRDAAVIGCGPFPESLVGLQTCGLVTGVVTGVDRDVAAARLAEQVARRYGPRPAGLRTVATDGGSFDFGRSELVLLVNGLAHKAELLERIRQTAPPGVLVLLRNPRLLGRLLYESAHPTTADGWRVIAQVDPTLLSRTLLLERTEH